LKYLLEQRIITPEQQKWVSKLLGYEYDIIYRPGKTNFAADALSRRPLSPTDESQTVAIGDSCEGLVEDVQTPILHALSSSSPNFHLWDELRHINNTNSYLQKLCDKLRT
jgi:hypothetical protein